MRKSVRDMGWFLRYVGYALVAGDPSILSVNTRGLRDILLKNCSLTATNVALQEMRAASAQLLRELPEARRLTIDCFNVLLQELAVATPSTRQKPGSAVRQGLQLPAIYALAAESAQRFEMRSGLSGSEKAEVVKAAYRQVFERDIAKGYSQTPCPTEASQLVQGKISMREFIRALGRSKEYRAQFYGRFVNSRVVELAYRHFLGRGISSLEEFRKAFSIVSEQGLNGLVDVLVNSSEYAQTFGEETVPYLRDLGEEAQESAGWGSNRRLFRFSAPFEGAPQYVTLYASYRQPLGDQHVYGGGNDPVGNQYGAIFPSATASIATRPAPFGYDTRRLLVSNGMTQPGQMDSPQFRGSRPRKVGPKVLRLQQIATGGAATPRRGGQPSIRNTESSTQAVIKAVYVQVLGTAGYAGERLSSEEARLENGDISLRDFVRSVARSNAFRRRYWEGLYITKAIEVMHRRLLGRPTFGRWEIDALFDTAARHGFYGVVDALINGQDYKDCFGEDTVPYERFITPGDLNTRRAPALRRPLDLTAVVDLALGRRPDAVRNDRMRTTSDVTQRNLAGQWSAEVSSMPPSQWTALMRRRPQQSTTSPSSTETSAPSWSRTLNSQFTRTLQPDRGKTGLASALDTGKAQGFQRRGGLPAKLSLPTNPSESELREVVDATYRQLLNRIPLESERLTTGESRLRDGQIDLEGFVAVVATSEAFQERLSKMAPLRAATAATMALIGRASTPAETSRFLIVRAESGQVTAVQELLSLRAQLGFEPSDVPELQGMNSKSGVAQSTLTRTASLYSGNAGLTPPPTQPL